MIDHDRAREILDLGAVEPGGLERMAAGDTAESVALAGHLAGCPDCAAEAARIEAAVALIRPAVASLPSEDLRQRTLALARTLGVPRPGSVELWAVGPSAPVARLASTAAPRSLRRFAWPAALAAAIALSVVGSTAIVGRRAADELASSQAQAAELERLSAWTVRIAAAPDARSVPLAAANGGAVRGTLVFSPATRELAVSATGLALPPVGMEYRCWFESAGVRTPVGRMYFAGAIADWVGAVAEVAGVGPGTRFGVSLAPAGGDPVGGDPVLSGTVGG
jgi:hypothetical protein